MNIQTRFNIGDVIFYPDYDWSLVTMVIRNVVVKGINIRHNNDGGTEIMYNVNSYHNIRESAAFASADECKEFLKQLADNPVIDQLEDIDDD